MSRFDQQYFERVEELSARWSPARDLRVRTALVVATVSDPQRGAGFRNWVTRTPGRMASLMRADADPVLLAAVAGPQAVHNLTGSSAKFQPQHATVIERFAALRARQHLELCRTDPAAAQKIEAGWASQRRLARGGMLSGAVASLEATYGTACRVQLDVAAGRRPLTAPPRGWKPTGPMARLEPLLAPVREASKDCPFHNAPVHDSSQDRSGRTVGRFRRWARIARGPARAEQLAQRSFIRVPVTAMIDRFRLRRALTRGQGATRAYLLGVSRSPRRTAAAIQSGLDPLVVAAAIGPKAVDGLVSGRGFDETTSLGKLGRLATLRDARRIRDAREGGERAEFGADRLAPEFLELRDRLVDQVAGRGPGSESVATAYDRACTAISSPGAGMPEYQAALGDTLNQAKKARDADPVRQGSEAHQSLWDELNAYGSDPIDPYSGNKPDTSRGPDGTKKPDQPIPENQKPPDRQSGTGEWHPADPLNPDTPAPASFVVKADSVDWDAHRVSGRFVEPPILIGAPGAKDAPFLRDAAAASRPGESGTLHVTAETRRDHFDGLPVHSVTVDPKTRDVSFVFEEGYTGPPTDEQRRDLASISAHLRQALAAERIAGQPLAQDGHNVPPPVPGSQIPMSPGQEGRTSASFRPEDLALAASSDTENPAVRAHPAGGGRYVAQVDDVELEFTVGRNGQVELAPHVRDVPPNKILTEKASDISIEDLSARLSASAGRDNTAPGFADQVVEAARRAHSIESATRQREATEEPGAPRPPGSRTVVPQSELVDEPAFTNPRRSALGSSDQPTLVRDSSGGYDVIGDPWVARIEPGQHDSWQVVGHQGVDVPPELARQAATAAHRVEFDPRRAALRDDRELEAVLRAGDVVDAVASGRSPLTGPSGKLDASPAPRDAQGDPFGGALSVPANRLALSQHAAACGESAPCYATRAELRELGWKLTPESRGVEVVFTQNVSARSVPAGGAGPLGSADEPAKTTRLATERLYLLGTDAKPDPDKPDGGRLPQPRPAVSLSGPALSELAKLPQASHGAERLSPAAALQAYRTVSHQVIRNPKGPVSAATRTSADRQELVTRLAVDGLAAATGVPVRHPEVKEARRKEWAKMLADPATARSITNDAGKAARASIDRVQDKEREIQSRANVPEPPVPPM